MKKIFFLMCLMLSALLVSAQETKRVAILETVDRQGNVSYSHKLILRSNLAKAITNTPGYEAYDRTDIDAIMGEQDFQRTGLVSNDQIKRLGEMTGAKYVLVAEAVVLDASTMYITVKLLNVETARLEMTDNKMMGLTPAEIQKGCEALANTLFGRDANKSAVKTTTSNKNGSYAQSGAQKEYKSEIIKISSKEYSYKGKSMDKKEYEAFIRNNCPQAWKQYRLGKSLKIGGWTCFAIGIPFIVVGGALLGVAVDSYTSNSYSYEWGDAGFSASASRMRMASYSSSSDEGLEIAGSVFLSLGATAVAASIPLLAVGYVKQKKSVDTYNVQCKSSNPMAFNLTVGQNGLGIAMNF